MTEEFVFTLPEPDHDDSEILEWRVKGFPAQLLAVLHRFTRIPNADTFLPVIAAYELMPLLGLNVCSGLFNYGPSGSGKSTIGDLLQLLNPRYDGSSKPLSAMDSPNGWLQSLSKFRWLSAGGNIKPCPFLAIDDLTSKTLLGEIGNQRLQIIKQLPNRNGVVTKGSADNEPQEFHTFCKFGLSSITDLGGIEGLSELNRRVILIRHKPLSEWIESDFCDSNRGIPLEKYGDFTGWQDYPPIKLIWLNEHRDAIVSDRMVVKRYSRNNRDTYPIPEMLLDFYNPIIAMGMTAQLWTFEQGIEIFVNLLESNNRKANDNHLTTILKQWLELDEGYGRMLRRFEKNNITFEVEYPRLVRFLKEKVINNELSRGEIQRQCILGSMSDLGYSVSVVGASPVIEMRGENDDI